MCTVIKVKRKITDDPVDCLILECKKRKKNISNSLSEQIAETKENEGETNLESIKQVLKYAGSAKNDNELSERLIELNTNLKSTVDNFIKNPKTPKPSKSKENALKETKKEAKSQRYVLLNKMRGVDNLDTNTIEKITKKELSLDKTEKAINDYGDMNILDVELDNEDSNKKNNDPENSESRKGSERITCNGVELIKEVVDKKQNDYVYDIYYAKNMDIHLDLLYPNNFTINSFKTLEFDDNVVEDEEEFYEDDEDSNDEGNWRNDYPDEDDDIDDECDEDGFSYMGYNGANDDYFNDEYDEESDYKLSAILRKSCYLDRSYHEDDDNSDDYEEYDGEDSKAYSAYKRKLIRDLDR